MPDGYSDELYAHMLREEYNRVMEREYERQMESDYCDWWNQQYLIEYEATAQYLISFDSDED